MKVLRTFLVALLISLVVGIAVGTILRLRAERPIEYIGSAPTTVPLDVVAAGTPILHPGEGEEQIA